MVGVGVNGVGERGGLNGGGKKMTGSADDTNDGGAELRAPKRGDAALACFPRAVTAPAPVASLVLGGDVRVSSSRASIDLFELVF